MTCSRGWPIVASNPSSSAFTTREIGWPSTVRFQTSGTAVASGDAYLSFITDTLKPRIDRLFRTRRGPAHTGILGSSMGGLISLYAWLKRPDVFSLGGALSPSLWFGRDRLFSSIESAPLPRGRRLYLDAGTAEGAGTLRDVRALRSALRAKGMDRRALIYLEDRGGRHNEAAWGRRLERAIESLLRRRT